MIIGVQLLAQPCFLASRRLLGPTLVAANGKYRVFKVSHSVCGRQET
jgi:hypothetical protein